VSILEGLRVHVEALGCRSNQYEAEALADAFAARGSELVGEPPWDVAVVVSCSVTAAADGKSRQLLRRFRRCCPEGVVVATGCWAQKASPGEFRSVGADLMVGNGRKVELPRAVESLLEGSLPSGTILRDGVPPRRWDALFMCRPRLHSRAFIKVQDGCDHFCSYCIIPYLRGLSVSRPLADVEREVRSVVASGCPEVVLTGIHLGLYGRDIGSSLGELVSVVTAVEGLRRLRFGSLEPFAIEEKLLAVLASSPVFSPHLHLPLQSGDDEVLRRMRRGYSADDFRRLVAKLRGLFGDDLHLGTDLLVGFPGETDAAFDRSMELLEELAFGRLHIFPFSPREGTAAASLGDRIAPDVVRERCGRAVALGERLLSRYARRWIGREVETVVERVDGGTLRGLTAHFVEVEAPAPEGMEVNDVVALQVGKEQAGSLLAAPVISEVIRWKR